MFAGYMYEAFRGSAQKLGKWKFQVGIEWYRVVFSQLLVTFPGGALSFGSETPCIIDLVAVAFKQVVLNTVKSGTVIFQ